MREWLCLGGHRWASDNLSGCCPECGRRASTEAPKKPVARWEKFWLDFRTARVFGRGRIRAFLFALRNPRLAHWEEVKSQLSN